MEQNQPDRPITLWGVRGSGKSWLLYAFAKELEYYNARDEEFVYELKLDDGSGKIIQISNVIDASIVAPTRGPEQVNWIFTRKPKGKRTSSIPHGISTHTHYIKIPDNPGQGYTEDGHPLSSIIQAQVRESRDFFILLDPAGVIGSPIGQGSTTFSQAEYFQKLKDLFGMIANGDGPARVAVCISKGDIIKFTLSPKSLIEALYGKDVLGVFENSGFEIEYFRVSAAGTIMDGTGRRIPNIDSQGHGLSNPNLWDPINVTAPFFWLFQGIEHKRLGGGGPFGDRLKQYIPYPSPRRI